MNSRDVISQANNIVKQFYKSFTAFPISLSSNDRESWIRRLDRHILECDKLLELKSLSRNAFNNVASISKGESGFRATGIFPLNPKVFSEEDFVAAEILQSEFITVQDCIESISANTVQDIRSIPSTSKQIDPLNPESVIVLTPQTEEASHKVSTIQDFIKLPEKAPVCNTRQGRKKQHATVLTSTPIKKVLIEKENKKITKSQQNKQKGKEKQECENKSQAKKTKVQKKGLKRAKTQVLQESNDTLASDINIKESYQDNDSEDVGNTCLICNEFGRNNEMWYRCTSCGQWAHADCTGWNSAKDYICDLC
ncbi:hypothetical protein ABEB36_000382 [Hypothenemus hampei]|uniref:Zinc finger PHD-type domain-containing protein n=1 Tax=Hypothenemus hampei TaxID=57062 RepID=A0ABD1FCZ0_HYPHA